MSEPVTEDIAAKLRAIRDCHREFARRWESIANVIGTDQGRADCLRYAAEDYAEIGRIENLLKPKDYV